MESSEIIRGAEAFYAGTVQTIDFAEKVMNPVLKGQIKPSKKETAIITIYFRMFLQLYALKLLNEYRSFQSVVACSRSIFEQLLDLKLLIENKVENPIDKFHAFVEIDIFKRAKDIVKFSLENPNIKIENIDIRKQIVNKKGLEEKIKILKSKYWAKKGFNRHWSGLTIKGRAELLGKEYEAFYYETYSMLSWYVHSGPSGHFYVNKDGLKMMFARGHELSQSMFIEATILVAKEFSLDKVVPNFYKNIEKLKLIPGVVLLKDREDIKEIIQSIFND